MPPRRANALDSSTIDAACCRWTPRSSRQKAGVAISTATRNAKAELLRLLDNVIASQPTQKDSYLIAHALSPRKTRAPAARLEAR
jgi:hypothetical protein